jgi:hypothetical protein
VVDIWLAGRALLALVRLACDGIRASQQVGTAAGNREVALIRRESRNQLIRDGVLHEFGIRA